MSDGAGTLRTWGRLIEDRTWTVAELGRMRKVALRCALTCDRRPSQSLHEWTGVATRALLGRLMPSRDATFVMVHGEGDYRAILPLARFAASEAIFALARDGEPLTDESGGPIRLIVPGRSRCDSVKGATGLEFLAKYWPGTRDLEED